MLKLMPFVKCLLCELSLTIYMHSHLLLKHVINTTFCQWPALKMDSVYYPKNYSYFPSAFRRVCVCPHVTGIQQSGIFHSEQQETLCISEDGLGHMQKWQKTQCGQTGGFRKRTLPLALEDSPYSFHPREENHVRHGGKKRTKKGKKWRKE